MAFLRPPGVGTMAEAVEGRTGTPEHRELGPPEMPAPPAASPGGRAVTARHCSTVAVGDARRGRSR